MAIEAISLVCDTSVVLADCFDAYSPQNPTAKKIKSIFETSANLIGMAACTLDAMETRTLYSSATVPLRDVWADPTKLSHYSEVALKALNFANSCSQSLIFISDLHPALRPSLPVWKGIYWSTSFGLDVCIARSSWNEANAHGQAPSDCSKAYWARIRLLKCSMSMGLGILALAPLIYNAGVAAIVAAASLWISLVYYAVKHYLFFCQPK